MKPLLILLTLMGFAGNSIFCRLALGGKLIDPVSFTCIRILSGAATLLLLLSILSRSLPESSHENKPRKTSSWKPALALFIYALSFSLAYLSLPSGTGALILFGVVQIMMLVVGFFKGDRMKATQWLGFIIACAGLIYLLSPGISAPDMKGAILMTISGIAWAFYTIAGKGNHNPIRMTADNFTKASPLTLIAILATALIAFSKINLTFTGISLAIISGTVTSAFAYSLWYKVLPTLSTTQAAILQLLVPLLASLGGALFIHEPFTLRTAIASTLILGGVIFSIIGKPLSPKRN